MELNSKLLEQIAYNTRPKIEEHMLLVMDKSTHEEHLSQPLQTNKKQFIKAVTFECLQRYFQCYKFKQKIFISRNHLSTKILYKSEYQ